MVDNSAGFCWGNRVKFLPSLSPLALASLALALCACANPANRRELYNTSQAESGPWHDYERRRQAEAETGVSAGTAPTVVSGTRGRPTAPPANSALPPGTAPAPGGPSAPAQVTESSSTGAPPVPINPPSPVSEAAPAPAATPDPAAPAATPAAP